MANQIEPNHPQLAFHSIQEARERFHEMRDTLTSQMQADGDCAFTNFFVCYADVYESMDASHLPKALHNLDESFSMLRLFLEKLKSYT